MLGFGGSGCGGTGVRAVEVSVAAAVNHFSAPWRLQAKVNCRLRRPVPVAAAIIFRPWVAAREVNCRLRRPVPVAAAIIFSALGGCAREVNCRLRRPVPVTPAAIIFQALGGRKEKVNLRTFHGASFRSPRRSFPGRQRSKRGHGLAQIPHIFRSPRRPQGRSIFA